MRKFAYIQLNLLLENQVILLIPSQSFPVWWLSLARDSSWSSSRWDVYIEI